MSMRQQNKRAQLRHGATTPAQEYHRDVEMREAVKAAVEQVNSAWCDSSSTRQQLRRPRARHTAWIRREPPPRWPPVQTFALDGRERRLSKRCRWRRISRS